MLGRRFIFKKLSAIIFHLLFWQCAECCIKIVLWVRKGGLIKMLKKCGGLALALLFILILSLPAWGEEANKEPVPLDQIFKESVLLPSDFKGNAFVNGELMTYNDAASFKIYSINGRILVPIRLAVEALTDLENDVYWNIRWDAAKPDTVTLFTSYAPHYKVVVTPAVRPCR